MSDTDWRNSPNLGTLTAREGKDIKCGDLVIFPRGQELGLWEVVVSDPWNVTVTQGKGWRVVAYEYVKRVPCEKCGR